MNILIMTDLDHTQNSKSSYCYEAACEAKLEFCRSDFCDDIIQRNDDAERLDARTIRKLLHSIDSYVDIMVR